MPAPERQPPTRTDSTSSWAYTKGLVGYYTDAEIDTLLAALPTGGGLQTVDLSAYATTAYVDGQVATLYSKAEVDALVANAATGDAGGARPAVYESPTAPAGDLKDGDLWLSPATVNLTTRQLSTLRLSDDSLAAMRKSVIDEVRNVMAGGKTVPADIDWTPCVKVAGSGLIEARVLNGMIQLRGELTLTVTATGTFTVAQRLPANFPKPPRDQTVVAFGYDTGVSYRRVFVRFYADGGVGVVGDGKITGTELTGAQAFSY
jgi:hypothetical protein